MAATLTSPLLWFEQRFDDVRPGTLFSPLQISPNGHAFEATRLSPPASGLSITT
jgi:hypothetical protein